MHDGGVRATRRAVVRTAVWTTPVVAAAAAAPAFAASCGSLTSGYLDWGANYAAAGSTSGVATVPISGGSPVVLTIASTLTNYLAKPENFTATKTQVGNLGKTGFSLDQNVKGSAYLNNSANNQLVTLSFSRKVYGLTFSITDIDSYANDFRDSVIVTSDGTFTAVKGSTVTGAGSAASPFTASSISATSSLDDSSGSTGNVKLTFSTAVTTISLRYWNTYSGAIASGLDGEQAIYVGPMSFQAYLTSGC